MIKTMSIKTPLNPEDYFLWFNQCADMFRIEVKYVDPRYTSQKCSACGFTDKNNRHKHKFVCIHCGHTCDADLNAAVNIKQNYILSLTNKEQAVVNKPIVAGSNT